MSEKEEYPKLILKKDGTYKIYAAPEIELKFENEDALQNIFRK